MRGQDAVSQNVTRTDVGTTELISHARPTSNLHFPSKQRRGSRVVTQPYVIGEYGRRSFILVQFWKIRPAVGASER